MGSQSQTRLSDLPRKETLKYPFEISIKISPTWIPLIVHIFDLMFLQEDILGKYLIPEH